MPPGQILIVYPSPGSQVRNRILIEWPAFGRIQLQQFFEGEPFQIGRIEGVDRYAIPEASLFDERVEERA